jgi:hypothetical protein
MRADGKEFKTIEAALTPHRLEQASELGYLVQVMKADAAVASAFSSFTNACKTIIGLYATALFGQSPGSAAAEMVLPKALDLYNAVQGHSAAAKKKKQ